MKFGPTGTSATTDPEHVVNVPVPPTLEETFEVGPKETRSATDRRANCGGARPITYEGHIRRVQSSTTGAMC